MLINKPFNDYTVGERWRSPRRRTLTETDVVLFAALTGDWHPLHTDVLYAERTIFGQRVAHGLLVLSIASGLVSIGPDFFVAFAGLNNLRFLKPVFIGDTIGVESIIIDKQDVDVSKGLILFELSILKFMAREEEELLEDLVVSGTVGLFVKKKPLMANQKGGL